MTIDERLQMVIKMSGLTNGAFADKIGVQRSSISHVLAGRNKPSIDFIEKVLQTFPRVDANWLVAGRKIGKTIPDSQSVDTRQEEEQYSKPLQLEDEQRSFYGSPKTNEEEITERSPTTEKTKSKTIQRVVIFFNDGTYEELGTNR